LSFIFIPPHKYEKILPNVNGFDRELSELCPKISTRDNADNTNCILYDLSPFLTHNRYYHGRLRIPECLLYCENCPFDARVRRGNGNATLFYVTTPS